MFVLSHSVLRNILDPKISGQIIKKAQKYFERKKRPELVLR
jgi:hypothetical protein